MLSVNKNVLLENLKNKIAFICGSYGHEIFNPLVTDIQVDNTGAAWFNFFFFFLVPLPLCEAYTILWMLLEPLKDVLYCKSDTFWVLT